MIKKVLFTILVAFVVLLFYKLKNTRTQSDPVNELLEGKLSAQLMAYIIIGFIVLFSSVFFALNWMDDRSLITVKVINAGNNITEYQIKKNALKGRTFTTIDGRIIELGDNERLEILPE